MAEWPEHSAELARKSLEHLHESVFRHGEARLSDAGLYIITDTIASITQGLIPADDWETIYAVREEMKARIGKK